VLRDVISSMDLAVYPMIAMVLFMGVFIAISLRTLRRSKNREHRHAAELPLRDDTPGIPSGEADQ